MSNGNSSAKRQPTQQTDEELFGLYIDANDQAAFEELHFRYRGPLIGYILRHYLRGQHTAAEDVMQTTFFKLHEKRDQFDRTMLFRPWLYSLAAHNAINHIEYMAIRPAYQLQGEHDGGGRRTRCSNEPIDNSDTALAEMIAQDEKLQELWTAAEGLPDQQREAVNHVFRDGLSYKEAAAQMGVPTSTLGVWIHRAVQVLRDKVSPQFLLDAA